MSWFNSFQVSSFRFFNIEQIGTRMKQIRFGGALIVTDFYTEMHRGFLKWMVLREIHRDRSVGRYTWHSAHRNYILLLELNFTPP